jgi:DNA-binding NarL/FixJ family response regulator
VQVSVETLRIIKGLDKRICTRVEVTSDLGLPKLTYMEEFKRIKQLNPNVRIIVVTGYLDPEMRSELLKAGVQRFIYRLYNPKVVLKVIREVLDGK